MKKELKVPLRIWAMVFYAFMAVIFVLSLLPIDHPDVSPNDKVNHFLAYGVLAITGCLAFRRFVIVVIATIAFGVMVELAQGLTSYRFMSAHDILANGIGVVCGCLLFWMVTIKTKYFKKG